MLDSEDSRRKIASLIKTYFKLGGLQLQVNSIDVKLLEAAYEHPEGYPELVVRIGGYSLKFTELDKAAQREFIERFKKESTR
jgi:formate C-acetyltransferase